MLRLNDIGYSDIFEMRALLEPYACRVVAAKEPAPDLTILDDYIQKMVEAKNIWDARVDYDIQFHIQIAEWTENPLLICFIKSMVDLWKNILVRGIETQQMGHQNGIDFHRRIVACLRAHDPDAAEETMRAHIEKSTIMCRVE
jgi:GntR family transcriptional repressor for pyruvate dehydrogenase complex